MSYKQELESARAEGRRYRKMLEVLEAIDETERFARQVLKTIAEAKQAMSEGSHDIALDKLSQVKPH